MIDFLLLFIILVVAWCTASEGAWGAGLNFLCVLFAGLLAMNWFEPMADLFQSQMGTGNWAYRWDVIMLLGLFTVFVFGFRLITEYLMPTFVHVHGLVYDVARFGFGLATGYVTMAIFLTALHTAPLPREFIGFRPERNNLFEVAAPDRQWLALTQFVSENSLGRASTPVFDGVSFERIEGKPETMQTWSSFPIRYASRREQFASGAAAAAPGSAAPSGAAPNAPPPSVTPSGNRPSGF